MLNWKVSKSDSAVIHEIAQRAKAMLPERGLLDIEMDLTAVHLNGNPLRLSELASADAFNFSHDIFGIVDCLDRETGTLRNGFSPRYSVRP